MAFRSLFSRVRPQYCAYFVREFSQQSSSNTWKSFVSPLGFSVIAGGLLFASPLYLSPTVNYDAVKKDIVAVMDKIAEEREDGTGIGPTFVRLAWHASGTYSKHDQTGGSNGATMRFSPEKDWGANAGLKIARDALETVKAKHPGITYADLWTLAGAVAIEEMGGPQISWRPGRSDSPDGKNIVPDGRLPNADEGTQAKTIQHVRDIFYRMGFNDREIVALVGAHALGRCREENSGYWGPWTRAETTFSNEFFRLLKEEKWKPKKTHQGKKWKGPHQFEDPSGELMMLPADMALTWDPDFKKYVDLYAENEEAFFQDFASAFSKLLELGVTFPTEAETKKKCSKKCPKLSLYERFLKFFK